MKKKRRLILNKIYNICIFAGTSEGRELIEYLSDNAFGQVKITACVATEYGEELIENTLKPLTYKQ